MYQLVDQAIDLKVSISKFKACGNGLRIFGLTFSDRASYYQDSKYIYVYELKTFKRYLFDKESGTVTIADIKIELIDNDLIVMPRDKNRKESNMSNSNRLQSILELADKRRDEIVPLFLGAPGIGKTQAVYEFAEKHNRKVVEIIASQILPSEVSGITMPDEKTGSMRVFDHARLSSLKDGDILFFDELWQADVHVLSACLTLIQERRMMSGKKLPDVLIVAAANPSVTPQMIPASIRQRFITINVAVDKYEFKKYIEDKYDIKLSSDILNRIVSDSKSWNFVTPRVIEKLIRLAIECESEDDRKIFLDFASSAYDFSIANEIMELVAKRSEPKPEDKIREIAALFNHDMDKDMDVAQMIKYLMSLAEWDDIKKQMEGIDV